MDQSGEKYTADCRSMRELESGAVFDDGLLLPIFPPMTASELFTQSENKRVRLFQLPGAIHLEIPDDGYSWLKYGQKDLSKLKKRRNYYRCALHKEKKCPAKRYVTYNVDNLERLEINYSEKHSHQPPRPLPGIPGIKDQTEEGINSKISSQQLTKGLRTDDEKPLSDFSSDEVSGREIIVNNSDILVNEANDDWGFDKLFQGDSTQPDGINFSPRTQADVRNEIPQGFHEVFGSTSDFGSFESLHKYGSHHLSKQEWVAPVLGSSSQGNNTIPGPPKATPSLVPMESISRSDNSQKLWAEFLPSEKDKRSSGSGSCRYNQD